MSSFKIEKGVPLAKKTVQPRGFAPGKYPFEDMEVGDSFFYPATDGDSARKRMAASTLNYGKRRAKWFPGEAPRKYSIRSVEGGLRVWRVE